MFATVSETELKPLTDMDGPRGYPVLGNGIELIRDPLGYLTFIRNAYGDYIRLSVGPFSFVTLANPADIHQVLVKDHAKYVKSRNYAALKLLLEDGLITAEGEVWKRKRKIVQPAVHPSRLDHFVPMIARCTEEMLARFEPGKRLDIHQEMTRLTLRIIGLIVMSQDLDGQAKGIGEAIDYLLHFADRYTNSLIRPPIWTPLPSFAKMRRYLKHFDELVMPLVEERRRSSRKQSEPDLLDRLLEASERDGQLSDRDLRSEIFTMIVAGHETTANALSFCWYLLAKNPETTAALRQEAKAVFGKGPITAEVISELKVADRVLREAMRLYPPVWAIERDPIEDVNLGGFDVPKGTTVLLSQWLTHRDPRHWENPLQFDPDRFLPERSAHRPRYAYFPFGAGPRVCVGCGTLHARSQNHPHQRRCENTIWKSNRTSSWNWTPPLPYALSTASR